MHPGGKGAMKKAVPAYWTKYNKSFNKMKCYNQIVLKLS